MGSVKSTGSDSMQQAVQSSTRAHSGWLQRCGRTTGAHGRLSYACRTICSIQCGTVRPPRLERRRCVLNAAPRAASLFVRAIVMSGACIVDADAGWGPGNHSYGLHAGAAFAHGASLQARKRSTVKADVSTLSDGLRCAAIYSAGVTASDAMRSRSALGSTSRGVVKLA